MFLPSHPRARRDGMGSRRTKMTRRELVTKLPGAVKRNVGAHLGELPLVDVVSLDVVESLARTVVSELAAALLEEWNVVLERLARELACPCPCCGRRRKCKRRLSDPMRIRLLGIEIDVPKLYLACGHCAAPGVSITKVLTGLVNGEASLELKIIAAYCAAKDSYGRLCVQQLAAHAGGAVQRDGRGFCECAGRSPGARTHQEAIFGARRLAPRKPRGAGDTPVHH